MFQYSHSYIEASAGVGGGEWGVFLSLTNVNRKRENSVRNTPIALPGFNHC